MFYFLYLETQIIDSHSCNGNNKLFSLGFDPDYSKPFILSMTIMARSIPGYGAIFSDRDLVKSGGSNRIELLWHKNQKIDGRVDNEDITFTYNETVVLKVNNRYDVAITFDGSKCRFYLDGNQFLEVNCLSGFKGMIPDPLLCRTATPGSLPTWGTGWNGLIENVRFDGIQKRGILMSLIFCNGAAT